MTDHTAAVFGARHASTYVNGPPRLVPGFDSLHRMMAMLLAERAPSEGCVLVLGAGGGLELKALAEAQAGWTFVGVDPSADMLALARKTAERHLARVELVAGYVETAPDGPFDAACCLLTFHFIAAEQRLETLRQIRRRLRPGAPFVLAHISFDQSEPARSQWIDRHIAYGGTAPSNSAREAIATRLTILAPDVEEAMLAEAGFTGTTLFYAGLSFRGWVAYAT